MKLKDCIPGTIVQMGPHTVGSERKEIGQICPGLRKNSSGEINVLVQWAGNPDPQTIHPGNIVPYKN